MKQRLIKKDYHKLQEEADFLCKRVQELERDCALLQATIHDQRLEIERHAQGFTDAQRELAKRKEEDGESRSRIEELAASLRGVQEAKERESRETTAVIGNLTRKLREKETCTVALRSEVGQLGEKINVLIEERDAQRQEIARQSQKVAELAEALKEGECHRRQEQKERAVVEMERDRLRRQLSAKEDEACSQQEYLGRMKERIDHLEELLKPKMVRLALRLSGHADA